MDKQNLNVQSQDKIKQRAVNDPVVFDKKQMFRSYQLHQMKLDPKLKEKMRLMKINVGISNELSGFFFV